VNAWRSLLRAVTGLTSAWVHLPVCIDVTGDYFNSSLRIKNFSIFLRSPVGHSKRGMYRVVQKVSPYWVNNKSY